MKSLLFKLGETFLSKLAEKLVDIALGERDEATFESLQTNMRLLRAKASDVEDAIKRDEQSGKKKRKREVGDWLEQVQLIDNELGMLESEMRMEGFVTQLFGGGRAAKLEARVRDLVEQRQHFGELVLDDCKIMGDKFQIGELVGEQFKKNLETIWSFLSSDGVSSIGIYGMGGVGKTTLAKHINNRLQEQSGEHVVWITVSQEFTISMLQDEIAKSIGRDLLDGRNESKRASRLNAMLSKLNNLVIIFDDVWKHIDLKKLGDPLSVDGCKIMITTRSKKVCDQFDCNKIMKVETLQENEAWILFKDTLGRYVNLTSEVQEIAKCMVKVCDGLPLGVITIAGSMKGETEVHVWSDALAELRASIMGQDDMEEYVFKVLKYSFDRLDRCKGIKKKGYSKLQNCFLYCSFYPEDWEIKEESLIRYFILEEFMDKRDSRKQLFIQGRAIVNRLVDVCLLERVDSKRVKMHDLVRAMALKIAEGKTVVIAGHHSLKDISIEEEWGNDIEKMSFMHNDIGTIPDGLSPNYPKLSTLLLAHNYPLNFIPDSFFFQMCSLFILDLSSTRIKKLPDSFSDIKSLKGLILAGCYDLEYLPYLGKLENLRELDLTKTAIQEVPRGMEELFNLNFLSFSHTDSLKMLPSCLVSKFRYLQCLYLPHKIYAPVGELMELKHLEEFRGTLKDVDDYNLLMRNRSALAYSIFIGSDRNNIAELWAYNHLEFHDYNFDSSKDKDATILAGDIQVQYLRLIECQGLSKCFVEVLKLVFNSPVSIESLEMGDCDEVECLSRIEQSASISSHGFFTALDDLHIHRCRKMKKLGLPALHLQKLRILTIDDCEMIEEIFEMKLQLGEASMVCLPKLECLYLQNLPNLKSICYSTTVCCCSIRDITLYECRALHKFSLVFGQPYEAPPAALGAIHLMEFEKKWWEKLELGHPSHHSLLQPFIRWGSREYL
ncbi:probable disease resistance protein At4g27220 isoform X2 [Andrographis paniculata]|nr:probable disease resistance protein At4g27220 isoform X2 [Andrographis paniculata]XP_051116757.1 probable disease resistance protein At4g27220 isoform X2 [Andrographis paniculata]XP_051116758.1 probable disease resistance protein At4g27220 isoform X2 [Andrographis paniculata]XP_051116759.1 probable disease resistance protein At4g27220 isoform X2 [Andrographis paniculata]XP_051116760.1 probable disease resistance protein At4g27220 isoform X2 [Andrographis paniculata]XP_051116761.1 probable d